jgi:hypothetical protein
MAEGATRRRGGQRGAKPLSASTRCNLLADLLARAERGDVAAAESLVRLSLEQRRAVGTPQAGATHHV